MNLDPGALAGAATQADEEHAEQRRKQELRAREDARRAQEEAERQRQEEAQRAQALRVTQPERGSPPRARLQHLPPARAAPRLAETSVGAHTCTRSQRRAARSDVVLGGAIGVAGRAEARCCV